MTETCPFCEIVAGRAPADIVAQGPHCVTFRPLDPVTSGHLLVVPRVHVSDACEDVEITVESTRTAAAMANACRPANLITSVGAEATQTVFHLHWHVIPRRESDGLHLPWTGQGRADADKPGLVVTRVYDPVDGFNQELLSDDALRRAFGPDDGLSGAPA